MSLRRKLALISLVLLVLPWAAWRFVGTTEGLLRAGEEEALLATTGALARSLASLGSLPADRDRDSLLVWPSDRPLSVDGYGDEWRDWPDLPRPLPHLDGRSGEPPRLALAERGDALVALIEARDHSRRYRPAPSAAAAAGDHLRLRLRRAGTALHYRIAPLAPGAFQALPVEGNAPRHRISGVWQETPQGYSVELRIPRGAEVTALGASVHDRDARGPGAVHGTGPRARPAATRTLRRPAAALARQVDELLPRHTRAWVLDGSGWVIAAAGSLDLTGPGRPWLRNLIYRYLLASPLAPPAERSGPRARIAGPEVAQALAGEAGTRWRSVGGAGGVLISAAQPLAGGGALVVEQASDGVLLLTERALGEVLLAVLLAVALALGALLAFAGRLSRRIRGLRDAAASAVGSRGEVDPELPERSAGDELGDLSRSLGQTLESLRRYTAYLRSLTGRLAHELRTPLAIVTSSLDNLDRTRLTAEDTRYLDRAQAGAERLGTLLRAMSEATRIEQSLADTAAERFDLAALLRDYGEAYQQLYPGRRIQLDLPATPCPLHGAPELVGQLLDKLVDNAASFSPDGGWIRLAVAPSGSGYVLSVTNQGPPLPDFGDSDPFDALVSQRQGDPGDGRAHLGLGLTIVRLVAERHGGNVRAASLDDGGGAVFRVLLRDMPD
ncbi:ATP-binding protein [Spiribacter halobius]|uniref:histidine kinase n=1 Tax=Sediminicurvatus halobius TaxID=2182432 RepID=A0A2U2N3N6_9GAMM|nr:ATP-binding protein [Spiribacter halobius]PWG63693.1 histidine kinase [Spiribacter halobius]UEX79832.1 HAMP domain-containing protein [Spiribacter halobius]